MELQERLSVFDCDPSRGVVESKMDFVAPRGRIVRAEAIESTEGKKNEVSTFQNIECVKGDDLVM